MNKWAAQMYALGAISAEQLQEFCKSPEEYESALKYAEEYSEQYSSYLDETL